jgi:hypothetical protein
VPAEAYQGHIPPHLRGLDGQQVATLVGHEDVQVHLPLVLVRHLLAVCALAAADVVVNPAGRHTAGSWSEQDFATEGRVRGNWGVCSGEHERRVGASVSAVWL